MTATIIELLQQAAATEPLYRDAVGNCIYGFPEGSGFERFALRVKAGADLRGLAGTTCLTPVRQTLGLSATQQPLFALSAGARAMWGEADNAVTLLARSRTPEKQVEGDTTLAALRDTCLSEIRDSLDAAPSDKAKAEILGNIALAQKLLHFNTADRNPFLPLVDRIYQQQVAVGGSAHLFITPRQIRVHEERGTLELEDGPLVHGMIGTDDIDTRDTFRTISKYLETVICPLVRCDDTALVEAYRDVQRQIAAKLREACAEVLSKRNEQADMIAFDRVRHVEAVALGAAPQALLAQLNKQANALGIPR